MTRGGPVWGAVWGAVCGLRREADCLPGGIPTRVAGGSRERAAEGARDLVAGGATAIVSFGYCGGLDPRLHAGDLVVADGVVTADGDRHPADADLTASLRHWLNGKAGWMLGADRVIGSPAEKRALFAQTKAVAVDMESHGVALAPAPFVILRVVADAADRTIPRSALAGFGADGRVRIGALLASLARRPWELADLLRLGLASRRATRTARQAAACLSS